jgi:hypothetical protein
MCQVCAHGKKKSERRVPIAATTIPQAVAKEPGTVPIKIQVEVVSPPNEPLPQKKQIPNIRCNCFDWSATLHLRSQSLHRNLDVGLFGII